MHAAQKATHSPKLTTELHTAHTGPSFTPKLTKTHLLVSDFHLQMTTSEMSNVGDAKLETCLSFGGIPFNFPRFIEAEQCLNCLHSNN